jgi:hypothetical protein
MSTTRPMPAAQRIALYERGGDLTPHGSDGAADTKRNRALAGGCTPPAPRAPSRPLTPA